MKLLTKSSQVGTHSLSGFKAYSLSLCLQSNLTIFLLYPKLSPRFSLASVHRGWSFGMRISLSVLMKYLGGVFIGLHWIYWSIWGELMFEQYWVSYTLTWSISIYLDHLWFLLSEFYSFSLHFLSLFLRQCNFLKMYFWLHWVFVAADGLSLVVRNGGCSPGEVCGLLTVGACLVELRL